ncbi:MAG: hypothetical protein U0556_10050 [Dehalococcoidia bacterium]
MASRPIDLVLARLDGVRASGSGHVARCPAHDDHHQSLSIAEGDDGRVLLFCHTGCSASAVAVALGIGVRDLYPARRSAPPGQTTPSRARIVATYDYRDESGALLYQAVRLDPKSFRQRRPDPAKAGGWLWNLSGVRRVLYRLPDLVAADPATPVYVVEGEKDVESLRGLELVAVCNVGGAGKWTDSYSAALAGRHVIIIPDLDRPGVEHAEKVARALTPLAASVRLLRLPGEVVKTHGLDISDWLAGGGDAEQLQALVGAAQPFDPDDDGDGRPWIDAQQPDVVAMARQSWEAIARRNLPPRLFLLGGGVVRVVSHAGEPPITRHLTDDGIWRELARSARFYEETERKGEVDRKWVDPPDRVVRAMSDSDDAPLPVLERLVEAPAFGRNGALLAVPGYDAESRTLYHPARPFVAPDVPERPSADDIRSAVAWLRDELLVDFPFASAADATNAIALYLVPLVRSMVRGATPLFTVEAPTPGSGKGKLVAALVAATTGREPSPLPEARDEDEWRKRITAALIEGHAVIFLDNVRRHIDSAVLAAVLTADVVTDRVLGKSGTVRVPNRALWVATGNNLSYSTEIARRIVRIRLTPAQDRPWLRKGFRHPSLIEWAIDHQRDGVWAGAVLVRAWLAAGRPDWQGQPIGSFEPWSRITGGILDVAGVRGFLDNALDLYEQSDIEGEALRGLVAGWWDQYQNTPVTVKDLLSIAREVDGLYLGRGKDDNERGQRTALGLFIRRHRDIVVGGRQIVSAGTRQGALLWALHTGQSSERREPCDLRDPFLALARMRAHTHEIEMELSQGSQGSQGSQVHAEPDDGELF